jgi:3-hydroxy-D-aspartate aldolase
MTHRNYSWSEITKILRSGETKGKLTRDDLPTPALMLDLDDFEYNIDKMTRYLRSSNVAIRPHGKTHKCAEIAKVLIRAGAAGSCVAKLSEAEAFADNGVGGLLITTAVIGKHKIERAILLARNHPDTIFCVDDAQNVRDLDEAAGVSGVRLNLAIDLLVGERTGVGCGEPALVLARLIASLAHVTFAGIQAYAGQAAHVAEWEKRRRVSHEAMGKAVETRYLLEKHGINVAIVTGGSTGTYNIDAEINGVTELQPGSFIFMDLAYNSIAGNGSEAFHDFRNSLSVLTTVVSKRGSDTAVVDGGFKAFATDQPMVPVAKNMQGVRYNWGGDEHGILEAIKPSVTLDVGDRVEFMVPHCDPTVNLYDRIFCLRGDDVETVWPITARGMSQ